jgi:hypothetical protein
MKIEGVRRDSIELLKSAFSETPEALNAVDVLRATGELIGSMLDSEVLRVADIDQAILAAPSV